MFWFKHQEACKPRQASLLRFCVIFTQVPNEKKSKQMKIARFEEI